MAARYRLSKKELKRVRGELERVAPAPVEAGAVEYARVVGDQGFEAEVYIIDGAPCAARLGGELVPLLPCLLRRGTGRLPRIVVDRGAASAVARGAKLMAPGVRAVEGDFAEGDIVVIVDQDTGAPVAVAKALVDSGELRRRVEEGGKGPVARVVHKPGDRLWKAAQLLASG